MTRHGYFRTRDSGCEPFLSASLWDDASGASLSVMSAFARLGLEPWGEANRLRQMPRHGAASALAAHLSELPLIGTEHPDYAAIATRLVKLLPESRVIAETGQSAQTPAAAGAGWWLAMAVIVGIVLQMNGWLF